MKAAVICEAYHGSSNRSVTVDVLVVAVGGGGGKEDGDGRSKGDTTARCFPAQVVMVCAMCVFVP